MSKTLEIKFRIDIDDYNKEMIREIIEDNLGVEILEINEGIENE